METNIILNTDSYKASHFLQYPPNTTKVFSYIESRGGEYDKTVMFGLQIFLKEYLTKPVTQEMIEEADEFFAAHGEPFNRAGWQYIVDKYAGYLPLVVRAVPEGMVLGTKNVLVTVENTDDKCFWLTSYIEPAILRAVWYGTTVATNSWSIKQVIRAALEETGDPAGLSFKLHDFGARGVSSFESAGIGGAAHLVNFMGSDTVSGIRFAQKYYNAIGMPGYSIPAGEHSSYTSWGRKNEVDAYRNMIKQFGGKGKMFAAVSDSYDILNAVTNLWGKELKQEVLDSGATVVIRPDSGDPASVVCEVVRALDAAFGSTVNEKGYKVLNPVVRVIQGDGINEGSIKSILRTLKFAGYSADNVAFGMGGALLQQVNRDTLKFAMKTSAACIDGNWVDVYKDPVTDVGKRSKKGRVTLYKSEDGGYFSDIETPGVVDALETVFVNGKIVREYTFDEVRANSTM